MPIAGCGATLIDLLSTRLASSGGLGAYTVALTSPQELSRDIQDRVGLILYRVDAEPTRRHLLPAHAGTASDLPQAPAPTATRPPAAPSRPALRLELRYLLAVWGHGRAADEQGMLGRCMQILDSNAVISGALLATGYLWEPEQTLSVSVDALTTTELAQLWTGWAGGRPLSVPYIVRNVRI